MPEKPETNSSQASQVTTNPPFYPPKKVKWKTSPSEAEYIRRPTAGTINETSQDFAAIQTGMQSYQFSKVALHPTATAPLKFLTDAPFWNGYHIAAVNDYVKYPQYELIDKYFTDLIQYQLENLRYDSFINILKGIWNDMLIYGFSISEMVLGFKADYWCLDKINTVAPYTFDFYLDEGWDIQQLFYRPRGQFIPDFQNIGNTILRDKFIIATFPRVIHGRHYGQSILQPVLFDIRMVEILEQTQAEGVRALSIYPMLLKYLAEGLSDNDLNSMEQALYNIDSGALVKIPGTLGPDGKIIPSFEVEVLAERASHEGIELIKYVLETLYKRINRQLGMPDDLGFSNADVGSYAKAKEQMNLYTQTIITHQKMIDDVVNKNIIPFILRNSYPSYLDRFDYRLPEFHLGQSIEEFKKDDVLAMQGLAQMGVLNPQDGTDLEWLREHFALPKAVTRETLEMPQANPEAGPLKEQPNPPEEKTDQMKKRPGFFKKVMEAIRK